MADNLDVDGEVGDHLVGFEIESVEELGCQDGPSVLDDARNLPGLGLAAHDEARDIVTVSLVHGGDERAVRHEDVADHVISRVVEEAAHASAQEVPVRLVGTRDLLVVEAHVEADDLRLPGATDILGGLGHRVVQRVDDCPTPGQVLDRRLLLRDRGRVVTDTPVVDDLREDVELAAQVRLGRRDLVFVDAGRVLLDDAEEELTAEELVPGEDVLEDLDVVRDGSTLQGLRVDALRPRRRVRPGRVPPHERPDREVRAALEERLEHDLDCPGRNHVVGVDEPEELAPGVAGASVARGPESTVRLVDDPNPLVAPRDRLDDRDRAVRRSVVDNQDLEPRVRLSEDRVKTLGDVLLDVVDRDDHRHEVPAPAQGTQLRLGLPGRASRDAAEGVRDRRRLHAC
nr:hypothetical protein [Luteimicrobium album]